MLSLSLAFLFTGCANEAVTEEETAAAILDAANHATSVETSISLIMDARIGSAGSIDGHLFESYYVQP